jgi:hypothetical protein
MERLQLERVREQGQTDPLERRELEQDQKGRQERLQLVPEPECHRKYRRQQPEAWQAFPSVRWTQPEESQAFRLVQECQTSRLLELELLGLAFLELELPELPRQAR